MDKDELDVHLKILEERYGITEDKNQVEDRLNNIARELAGMRDPEKLVVRIEELETIIKQCKETLDGSYDNERGVNYDIPSVRRVHKTLSNAVKEE